MKSILVILGLLVSINVNAVPIGEFVKRIEMDTQGSYLHGYYTGLISGVVQTEYVNMGKGIRPEFCVPPDLTVQQVEDILYTSVHSTVAILDLNRELIMVVRDSLKLVFPCPK